MSNVSAALETALSDLNWKQKDFGEKCGLDKTRISGYVCGSSALGGNVIPKILAALPMPQRAHVLAAYLRDDVPQDYAGIVDISPRVDGRAAAGTPFFPELDAKMRAAFEYLARRSAQREIRDLVIDLHAALAGHPPIVASEGSHTISFPVYGQIAAGLPSQSDQIPDEFAEVPESLARKLEKHERGFVLRVHGDSMKEAKIRGGDLVLIAAERQPRHGDIVVALDKGESLLKRYLLRKGKPVLHSENPAYQDIVPSKGFAVQGVMVAKIPA